jgi:hypothetical protein
MTKSEREDREDLWEDLKTPGLPLFFTEKSTVYTIWEDWEDLKCKSLIRAHARA